MTALNEKDVVIASAVRTPIGSFQGALASLSASRLGAVVVKEAVKRAGADPAQIERVIMGNVLSAGMGQAPARQAVIYAELPVTVGAVTVNKVCGSGLQAVMYARREILVGDAEVLVAGGMESMTNAPYLMPKAREGSRLGDVTMIDSMIHDGLWCAFDDRHMGAGTDVISAELGVTRADQDAWSARSHARAAAAWESGRLAEEVVPVDVPQRKGDPIAVARDEGIRPDTTAEGLANLKPAFSPGGTVTAGNASQISDGAAAVVVMSAERAAELGLHPIAEIVAYGMTADRYASLHTVPAVAMQKALKKAGLDAADLGLVEINEAFAAVSVHASRMLGLDEAIVNANGGAVAFGHPVGMSGARIVLTLAHEMRRRGVDLGGAAICGGGGQGDALILRALPAN